MNVNLKIDKLQRNINVNEEQYIILTNKLITFSISFHYICVFCIFRKKNNCNDNYSTAIYNQPPKFSDYATKTYNAASVCATPASIIAVSTDQVENSSLVQVRND